MVDKDVTLRINLPASDPTQPPAHTGEGAEPRKIVIRVAGLLQQMVRPISPT
jgi:hypothetical protein